jgi:3-deoxy-D-manno-octulosonic-acid transferase
VPVVLNLIYLALLLLAAPLLVIESLRTGKYREGWAQKFLGRVPLRNSDRPCAWLHAVSVGEVNLLKTLIAELASRHPDWQCVISTTTLTGYRLAKSRYPDLSVFYCPLDFSWAVRTAMRRIRPNLLVLAELELWPNLIWAAGQHGARVAVVNGRLSDKSYRGYRRIRRLIAPVLARLDLVAAQTGQYAERFLALGACTEVVYVSGSLKFDGAQTNRQNPVTVGLRKLAGFLDDDCVFLAGSTQWPEEQLALATYRELVSEHPRLRLVIVPRHPERFNEVAELLDSSGLAWQRRSALESGGIVPSARVLLVDRVGELGVWWGAASVGLVGGSLGKRGGQNMIEPAAYGVATCFGPQTHNFRDVVSLLLAADAAVVVRDGAELTDFVRRALVDPAFAAALGAQAQKVVSSQLGATSRTVDLLSQTLSGSKVGTKFIRAA